MFLCAHVHLILYIEEKHVHLCLKFICNYVVNLTKFLLNFCDCSPIFFLFYQVFLKIFSKYRPQGFLLDLDFIILKFLL